MLRCCVWVAVLIVFWPCLLRAEDRYIEALRGEVDQPAASDAGEETPPSSGESGHASHSCPDGDLRPRWSASWGGSAEDAARQSTEQAVGWMFFYGLTLPWWGPHAYLEHDAPDAAAFPIAPYAEGSPGYIVIDDPVPGSKDWAGRVSLDSANNFDGVTTLAGRLRLDTVFRLGIDAEWANLVERTQSGTDWLGRGDCNLVFRFAQSPRVQFHSGVGFNWLADHRDSDYGFNFTYGVDLFPVDPVLASATLDLGTIGDSRLVHFRGTLGLMVRPRLHVYTGYDLLEIGGTSIHSLLTGIEFWF